MASLSIDALAGLELYLDAVRLGSISAAAREHHLSQPSATERIRGLERRLGVTLLRRGPSGSEPTPEGEAVVQWAQPVLEAVDQLATAVAAMSSTSRSQPLRIMASLTVAEYVLPRWLHARRAAGGAPVELRVGNSVAVEHAVTDGGVRLGFVETPRRIVGLRTAAVGGDRLVVIVAPDHPWARRRRPVTPDELAHTPLLQREVGSGTRDAFDAALASVGLRSAEPANVLASTTTLKSAVAAGDGVCVLSGLAVQAELAAGLLVEVAVDGLDLRRQFRAIWRPERGGADLDGFVRLARAASRG